MNADHACACASDEWRATVRDFIIPAALDGIDLGDDVLEIGPGYGATTDVLRERVPRLTAVEIDPELAAALVERYPDGNVEIVTGDATAMDLPDGRFTGATSFSMLHHVPSTELQDRLFAEVARVLRSGATFVASDSIANDDLQAFHHDDIYVPIDPDSLPARLGSAGFVDIEVRTNEWAWTAISHKP